MALVANVGHLSERDEAERKCINLYTAKPLRTLQQTELIDWELCVVFINQLYC